jgi:hypothetical protein
MGSCTVPEEISGGASLEIVSDVLGVDADVSSLVVGAAEPSSLYGMSDPFVMPRFGGVESVVVVGSVLVESVAGAAGGVVDPGASAGGSVPTLVSVDPAAAPVDEVWVMGSGVPVESVVIDAPVIEPASAATTGDDAYAPLVPAGEDEEDAGEANE